MCNKIGQVVWLLHFMNLIQKKKITMFHWSLSFFVKLNDKKSFKIGHAVHSVNLFSFISHLFHVRRNTAESSVIAGLFP